MTLINQMAFKALASLESNLVISTGFEIDIKHKEISYSLYIISKKNH